MGAPTTN